MLRDRLAALMAVRAPGAPRAGVGGNVSTHRDTHPPVPVVPDSAFMFGPGMGYQPSHELLYRYNLGTTQTGTRAIRNRIASIEPLVRVRRRVADGTYEWETLDDHPLKALLDKPHPDFSRAQILGGMAEDLVTCGESYLLKVGNGLSKPAMLLPLQASRMRPLVSLAMIEGYAFTDGNGVEVELPREVVVRAWIPDPANPFGARGWIGPNGIAVDAARFAGEHTRRFYERNGTPTAVIEHDEGTNPPTEEEERRFLEKWNAWYNRRAGRHSGAPLQLPPGRHWMAQPDQTGEQIVPLHEYFDKQELRNLGVPQSVVGVVQSGDRSSAEVNEWVFDRHTILPLTKTIEQALTDHLAADFAPDIIVEFEDFVSEDKDYELKREAHDLTHKLRTINEVRQDREGFEPVAWGELPVGTLGEEPYTGEQRDSMAFQATDPDANDEEPEDVEEPDDPNEVRIRYADQTAFFERLYGGQFALRMRRIFAHQRAEVIRRFRRQRGYQRAPGDELFDPQDWMLEFARELMPIYQKIAEDTGNGVLRSILGTVDVSFIFTDEVRTAIRAEGAALVTRTGATTKKRITQALEEGIAAGESEKKLERRLDQVFARRSRDTRTIARTEVGKAVSVATMEGARQSGVVTHKRWLHSGRMGDPRDAHVGLNGKTIPLGEAFEWRGEDGNLYRAQMPRGPGLPANEVINCQCDLSFPRIKG